MVPKLEWSQSTFVIIISVVYTGIQGVSGTIYPRKHKSGAHPPPPPISFNSPGMAWFSFQPFNIYFDPSTPHHPKEKKIV